MTLPMAVPRGVRVAVLRLVVGDHSGGGITARHPELTIVGVLLHTRGGNTELSPLPGFYPTTAPTPTAPPAWLVKRSRGVSRPPVWYVAPVCGEPGQTVTRYLDGGNAAHLGGSLLGDVTTRCACLPVHDRLDPPAPLYPTHDDPAGAWCPWSGTLRVDRLPDALCPAGHKATPDPEGGEPA